MAFDLFTLCADIESRHSAAAGSRIAQSAQHAHGGGLPGPVGSEEAEYLTFTDIEADVVHSREGAEAFGEISHRYCDVIVGHFV